MQLVVQRELRVTARKAGTYWMRVVAGGMAGIAFIQYTPGISNGRGLFFAAVIFAFGVSLFESFRRSAASIARERREETLGLLLLTPLTGPELVRGKFAAIAISTFQIGFAATPVLAASLLLGGVSGGEFVRAILALCYALSLMIVLGLRISAFADDEDVALKFPMGRIVAICFVLSAVALLAPPPWRAINPMTPLISISDFEYSRAPWTFWIPITFWQSVGWFEIRKIGARLIDRSIPRGAKTISLLPSQSETVPKATPIVTGEPSTSWRLAKSVSAPRWFWENPMEWFVLRDIGMHDGRWGALILAAGAAIFAIVIPPAGIFIAILEIAALLISLCLSSTRPIARLKESGILELLLTTPLGEKGILEGHLRGLRRMFFWPAAVVIGLVICLVLEFRSDLPVYFGLYLATGIFFAACATPWIGILTALKSRSAQRAVGWTQLLILVVPRLFFCWLGDAPYFILAGLLARDYVQANFRRLVAGEKGKFTAY